MIERVIKLNECGDGGAWHQLEGCTLYPSKISTPVVTFIHPGSHAFPSEAPSIIVRFFKEQTRRG
jgi:polyhydroxybutyrate depolymerase